MKKVLIFLLLICVSVTCFGLDWYGFFFDAPPVGVEYEITGTVFDVSIYKGEVYAVILYTSFYVQGFYTRSPIMLWYAVRPIVNDGDEFSAVGLYSGIWTYNGMDVPTFRAVE